MYKQFFLFTGLCLLFSAKQLHAQFVSDDCAYTVERVRNAQDGRRMTNVLTYDSRDSVRTDLTNDVMDCHRYNSEGLRTSILTVEYGDVTRLVTYKYKKGKLYSETVSAFSEADRNSKAYKKIQSGKSLRHGKKDATCKRYTLTYDYNDHGDLASVSKTKPNGYLVNMETYAHGYDRNGHCIKSMKSRFKQKDQQLEKLETTDRIWDNAGRLAEETTIYRWGAIQTKFTYDAAEKLIRQMEKGSLNWVEYSFDASGRIAEKKVYQPKGTGENSKMAHDFTVFRTYNADGKVILQKMMGANGVERYSTVWTYSLCE